ncbi:response regulator transcription factor [Paenibacillus sp. N3/727]|uniref:response regulator transcription factor n=1 Tax=Paenibacillus sp. N3/727 TaxID=2925845 RepID=UPI001F53CD65|nr:response regulator transcription factor [Paenibacillus sp. N3/727]UNK16584.1 response regulator transcription factor [Paenibacillus sp. N3/727]
MIQVLVVEDDKNLRKLIAASLEQHNYQALQAANSKEALRLLESSQVDLMISDIMMPETDGYELTQMLRNANYYFPILMVTAREDFEDKKRGFMAGTDDYMVKPLDLNEMLLRVAALLRRAKIANEHRIVIGNSILDYNTLTVTVNEASIELPKKEFYLLFKLLSYPGKIFTRQQLMDEIWGLNSEADERTVDVHVKRLREKLEPMSPFRIITVRGLGYKAEKMT